MNPDRSCFIQALQNFVQTLRALLTCAQPKFVAARLGAAGWAEDYDQQRVTRQSAGSPVDVVPVAKDSNRKNKNGNDNQASGFQSVWRGRPARVVSAFATSLLA